MNTNFIGIDMKLIIDNKSDLSIHTCLELVSDIILQGRVSNNGKQYCYCTSYRVGASEYLVSTDLNPKSDKFVITRA